LHEYYHELVEALFKGGVSRNVYCVALGGFGCAEIGKRLPVIRNLGAAAIFATFVPSYLAFAHLLLDGVLKPVAESTKASNFLYLFIAAIIVGSIFGMDRQVLIKGFVKIFVPLSVSSVAAGAVGTLGGVALGLGAYHTFFYIVIRLWRAVSARARSRCRSAILRSCTGTGRTVCTGIAADHARASQRSCFSGC
jgi:Na+/citrate or Na+/malate symporter